MDLPDEDETLSVILYEIPWGFSDIHWDFVFSRLKLIPFEEYSSQTIALIVAINKQEVCWDEVVLLNRISPIHTVGPYQCE